MAGFDVTALEDALALRATQSAMELVVRPAPYSVEATLAALGISNAITGRAIAISRPEAGDYSSSSSVLARDPSRPELAVPSAAVRVKQVRHRVALPSVARSPPGLEEVLEPGRRGGAQYNARA